MKHEKTYAAPTISMGDGLFARRLIQRGETIFMVRGRQVRVDIRDARDSELLPRAIGIADGVWLDPFETNPLYYLNHSCAPNAGISGSRTLTALRDIQPGEQITFDYAITESDRLWRMDCSCGAQQCRKVIRSIQFLPREAFVAYLPYVPRHFREVYEREHGRVPAEGGWVRSGSNRRTSA